MTGLMYALIEGKLKKHPHYIDTMQFIKREEELDEMCPLWIGSGFQAWRSWSLISGLMDDCVAFRVCQNMWDELKIIAYVKREGGPPFVKRTTPEEVRSAFDEILDSEAQVLHMKYNSPLVSALMTFSPEVEMKLKTDLEALEDVWGKYVEYMTLSTGFSMAHLGACPFPDEKELKDSYWALHASLKTRFPAFFQIPEFSGIL